VIPILAEGGPELLGHCRRAGFEARRRAGADAERILRRLDLSAGEAADLAAFLRSLSAGPVPSTLAQ